ncbi:unnamed protein product, partial [Rotaria magnacalcarata]
MKNSKDEKQKTVPSEAAGETNVPLLSAGNASLRINNSTAVSGSDIPPVA